MTEREIFTAALEKQSAAERDAFLEGACANDSALREHIEGLLRERENLNSLLERPPAGIAVAPSPTVDRGQPEQPGTLIGRYKLLEQVGEGGMGVVYVAEQTEPVRRRVALKIIKPGMDTKLVIARFEAERQALAMMDHPNIAKVLDAGTTEAGRPYFVMELVRGMPITEYCDQDRLSPHQRLKLLVDVCHAVQHAHQKGIIHRDLKPSNVMITLHDGTPVVKVIDFGVAKAVGQQLTERTVYTALTQMVGTPLYMSPEQAEMSGLDVDTRSDVYSLGVLLYELLTGMTPFDKETLSKAGLDEMRRIIREDEPLRPSARVSTLQAQALSTMSQRRSTDPRRISATLRGELDWIVMKALEKDRSRRYESASALATDIQRYLSDEPVLACPPTTMYRFQKFARKHKPALATAAAIAGCLILGTTVSAWQAARATTAEAQANANANQAQEKAQEASQQRDEAQKQRDEVKSLADRLQRTLYASNMNLAKNSWDKAAVPRVLGLLEQHRPQPGEPDIRGFEWHYLNRLCRSDAVLTLHQHEDHNYFLESAAFTPDGKRVLTITSGAVSNSGEVIGARMKFWDAQTGQELFGLKGLSGYIFGWEFSPDGKRLASASGAWDPKNDYTAGVVKIWDVQTGEELLDLKGHTNYVGSVAFSGDGKRLASASSDNAKVWDLETGKELFSFETGGGNIAFSPDGKRLAHSTSRFFGQVDDAKPFSREVKLRDAETGKELLSLQGGGPIVAYSPDGKRLASMTRHGRNAQTSVGEELKVWDAETGQEIPRLNEKSEGFSRFAFSPDSKRLAVAGVRSKKPRIKVFDAESGEELFTFQDHTDLIISLAFSRDSRRLASASKDRTVRIWNLATGQETRTLKGHTQTLYNAVFSPDGNRVVSASQDGSAKVWNVLSDPETLTLNGSRPAISPDFKRLAGGSSENTVKIWDAYGKEILTLTGHTSPVHSVAFSADGKRIVSSDGTQFRQGRPIQNPVPGVVKVWDALTGRELLTCAGPVGRVAFSPDGKRLAGMASDKTVKIWDAESGHELFSIQRTQSLPGGGGIVAFSLDGKRLAFGDTDETTKERILRVRDAQTGQEFLNCKGHTAAIMSLAFSPDSKRLASAAYDAIRIWDAHDGLETLAIQEGHAETARSLAFSPDGKRLASASMDGTVKVWDAQTGQETLTFEYAGTISSSLSLPSGANGPATLTVAFSADGHKLALLLWDGTVKIWDATPLPEKP